ncbi:iron-sulfur assembly protein 1 [[Candida] railenensis]|uniref:Iron-sulfur assembly protein 1 n=1 Tax=[Candida] railenensis TaxID=45579 RepID=A0A9P0QTC6_9ASCO|nr:iron-sulfur assembly protein 1 [[Candida] railenensis]
MLRVTSPFRHIISTKQSVASLRSISGGESVNGGRRFLRTIPISNSGNKSNEFTGLNYSIDPVQGRGSSSASASKSFGSKWAAHSLSAPQQISTQQQKQQQQQQQQASTIIEISQPQHKRRSRASRFKDRASPQTQSQTSSTAPVATAPASESVLTKASASTEANKAAPVTPEVTTATASAPIQAAAPAPAKKKRTLRPRKALITLTPSAVHHLQALIDQPEPKLIRIGVKNRGCSGLTYHLEYVTEGGKFDELVEQDGVKVLIDSKALFSIVGSQMDWLDDKLSSRFIFRNPNSKGTCGCGESFMV